MEMIRDEAEKERVDRDYDGDNSSNDIEHDEEEDDEDEDMDEDGSEEDSESDESEESESSSSGSSDEENDSEMDGSDELEDISRVSMSEYVPGCQDEGDLRLPPQGSIFGGDDMAQDHGYRNNLGPLGTGGASDLVSSTHGHDPLLHNDYVLQKMEVDYGPGYPHPPEQSNNVQLYNTLPPTTWDSPASFGQGFQFTFTPFTHTSNQPQSNRNELHISRSDPGSPRWEQDPFVGSSTSAPTTLTPPSLSADSTSTPSNSNMPAPRPNVYTSNRAFFTLSRSVSRCWKRPKRS